MREIDFIGRRATALYLSTVLNLLVLCVIAIWGLRYGIDFAGGTDLEVSFTAPVSADEVRSRMVSGGLRDVVVQRIGSGQSHGYLIHLRGENVSNQALHALAAGRTSPDFEVRRTDFVGPQVGRQLRNKGIIAIVFAMLAIAGYVAFRFDFKFAPGALVALIHDAIMVLGYYAIFRREFTLTSIAALLTVVGYSVNDKVVIFDRIREEMGRLRGKPLAAIINTAINKTLRRTFVTGGVTSLSLLGLVIFATGDIFDFAMSMLIGIFVGTYSSIFIGSELTLWIDSLSKRRALRPVTR
ncbi:MAG TPA: protein translocase subunit SecF [Myxococcaceae bacterium]|nr:protein translocase subunit SecF [Myxococcaceae bacterium]